MVDEGSWFHESNGCFLVYKDIENLCGIFPFGLYRFYMIINVLYIIYKNIYIHNGNYSNCYISKKFNVLVKKIILIAVTTSILSEMTCCPY